MLAANLAHMYTPSYYSTSHKLNLITKCASSFHCFYRGVASVFNVWLENFSFDFDDPPKYTTLSRILSFVTSEMRDSHRDDLARKMKLRLDKFQITPYEDEGEMLTIFY